MATEKHEDLSTTDYHSGEGDELEFNISESSLIRKLDFHLLPILTFLYLLSFLDRSNVANAKVEGLDDDLHMTGNQYLTGLTLYFIGYVLFEVPCNIVLRRTTPKFWLPTLTVAWGVVSTLQGVVQNMGGFYAVRFFLGMTESGLFPGVVFYLSMWYKRRERQFRIASFFSAASLAGAFGGILAYGIAHMNGVGGLAGWRWIFILEGIFTVLVASSAYFFVVNYPSSVSFLSDDEKARVHQRLKDDSDSTNHEGFTWVNVSEAFKDIKCWLYSASFHCQSLPLYTLSLFLPTIIKELGYTAAQAQLLTVPPYALATVLTLTVAYLSERTNARAPWIMLSASCSIIGYIILLANSSTTSKTAVDSSTGKDVTTVSATHPWVSYVGVFFAAGGIYPATALCLSWPAINVSGQTKRATANAMQISIGNLGAVIGTQLYRSNDGPRYIVGHSVALAYCCGQLLVSTALWYTLRSQNRKRDRLVENQNPAEIEGEWRGDADLRWRFTT